MKGKGPFKIDTFNALIDRGCDPWNHVLDLSLIFLQGTDIPVQKLHPFMLAHVHLAGVQPRPTHIQNTPLLEPEQPINVTYLNGVLTFQLKSVIFRLLWRHHFLTTPFFDGKEAAAYFVHLQQYLFM